MAKRKKSKARAKRAPKAHPKRVVTTTHTVREVRALGEFSTRQGEVHASNARRHAKRAEAYAKQGSCSIAVTQLVGAALQTGAAMASGSKDKGLHNELHRAEISVRSNCAK